MGIASVQEGTVLICPLKVAGGGVHVGNGHTMQGNGEITGHTAGVSAEAPLQVSLLKGLKNGEPILLPLTEDLPYLARPLTGAEREAAKRLADACGQDKYEEEAAPIQMVGSGANRNEATDNGVTRLAELLGMSKEEVLNRVTLTGGVEIRRLPGVVTVTMLAPWGRLEDSGMADLVRSQYGL